MEALIYFAIWAIAIFLIFRFGCGAHVMGHGHRKQRNGRGDADASMNEFRWVPPERDTDPVCGKSIKTSTAKPSVHDGTVFYFCSRECREVFEAAPEQYVASNRAEEPNHLEKIHA